MKTEDFKSVSDLRKLREDALIKAYEKMVTECYSLVFLPNWSKDKMKLEAAENIIDKMDQTFEREWRYIGELYGLEEPDEEEETD